MGYKRPLLAVTGACAVGMPGVLSFVTWAGGYHHSSRLLASSLSRVNKASPGYRPASIAAECWRRRHGSVAYMSTDNGNGNQIGTRKKVVFLGTPEVAALSLELLLEASREGKGGGFDIVRAVSNPPARTGRKKVLQPCPVQALAESEGVPILTPATARDEDFLAELENLRPDLCVTAAYGQFLPQRFLDIPKFGTLNVHPSLLPRYRGASPVQRCLEAGDSETGVTVAFTVLKMDAGPVVRQTVRKLEGCEKTPEMLQELFHSGTKELIDCLPQVWDGSVEKTPQDDSAVVKAAKISVLEARCCFKTSSAGTIHNKVRAFAGWPGTWALFTWGEGANTEARKVKLTTTAIGEFRKEVNSRETGTSVNGKQVVLRGDALELTCGDGSILRVLELQPMNKNVMGAKAFANGLRGAPLTWVELEAVETVPA